MKKFMIFLLMAFLYLGTCQARSEATHLNGANDKLHSWVTPSTLFGSPSDMHMSAGDVPPGTPIHKISPSQPQNLCLNCDHNQVIFVSNWNANGYTLPIVHVRRWYVNDMPTDSLGETFQFVGYPVGQYTVKCVVEYVTADEINFFSRSIQSNSVIVTVVNDFTVNIVGPDHACQNDQVTLSAVVSDASLPVTYQWRRDGQYIVGAESSSYEFMVSSLPGLTDTLVHEFDVQVTSQAGPGGIGSCDTKYSPVHYFSVSPVPVTLVDVPLFCNNASSVTVTTSSYTSGGEQPYMWKWTKVGSTDTATTYVNYFTIDNPVSGGQYKVMPIYQDFACNADTALFELKSYQAEFGITAALKNITLEGAPDLVCLGGMTTLTVTDNNPTSYPGIGEATYTWYMNGTLIEGVTGKTYTTELSTTGEYAFAVVASYANYPCETPQAYDTVKVDSVATSVTLTGGNVLCENPDGTFTSTLITAHVTPTTGTFEYMWTGQTAFSTKDSFLVNTPGVYNVIVRSAAGCETASMPFEVTGFGADVQVTAVITNACAGEPVVLNANAAGWTGSIAYTWNTGSHSPSIIVTPTVDSVFTVTSTATMGANATCSRTDTFKVVILPAIAVKPILAVALDSVCVGSLASVYVANDATVGAYTYQWYMDGVEIPGQNLDSISVAMATPGIHTFTARPLSVNGCISDSISAPVTVKVKDAVHYITITGDNVLCEMTDSTFSHTTLTANVAPINLSYKYKWNTQTEFSNNNTLTVETPGVYTVTVKTMEGCEVVSAPFNVTGFGANVLISSTETSCPGEPVTLSASSQGWTGSISYTWEGIPGNYPTVTVFPKRDTTYKVTTTVIMESGVSCSRVDSIHVYVLPIATVPTVAVVGVDSICEGSLANLAVTNHVNGAYYVWYQNGVVIPGHNLDSISVVLETPGVYEFTAAVVTANGCTTPDSEVPAVVTVKPVPGLVNITGDDVICEGDTTTLFAHVSGEITNPTYAWSTSSDQSSIRVPAGVYTVTVTNGQMTGCAATAEFVVKSFGSDVMLTANSQHVCAGADVILNIAFDGWVGANMSHSWVDPDGIAMPGSSQVTASPAKEGWYKVTSTATSTSGTCSRLDSIYVNVDTLHVTDLKLTSPYDTICLGAQAAFKAVCPGADRFVWYENGVVIPGQNLDSIVVMPQAAGSYTYSVAGINTITGCVSEDTTLLPALLVLDNPSMMISGDAIVCDTTMVELYAHINDTTYAHDNFNYVWRVYNDTLTPDIDSIYNWQAGEWQVILTDMTGAPANHGILMTDEFTPQDEPYVIMVQATNERGCVATSDLFYLYIGASPTVAVTIDHDTICEGGLVTATAHLGNYNMDNLVYQWYEKNKVTGVIDTVAHGTSRIYTTYVDTSVVIGVRVTQTTTECSIYGEDSVFVLPVKLQKIIASNETHNSETDTLNVCKGEGVYLTAYVINEETGLVYVDSSFTYVWYENGFLMPGVTGPTFHKQMDIEDDDTLSYQYTAYIDFGVEGCEPKLVSSNVVFVKRNPIVTIAGHHNVCYYGSYTETHTYNIHLIAWVDGDYDPNMTYTWYEHNQLRYNVGGSIYDNHYRENWVPTYDNPYSFTVEVANSDGCVTISEPFEVNVYNKPDVNITATETTICKGGETELTAHLNNYNDPNLIYQWYIEGTDPNNAIPGMTEPTETYVVDTTTTYLVKVTHLLENGSLTAQACFNVASIVITANDIPVIDSVTTDLADGNDTICEGRYVTFTAHMSKGVQGGELYTWFRNGEVIATTPDPVYRETPQALNGDITVWDYAVKVTQAASGCESEIKGADTITVFPNPVLVLVTDPIVCDTLTGNIVMHANVTPAPTSTYNFTWYEDNQVLTDGTAAGSHSETMTLTRPYRDYPYSFSVELVNEYGCTTRDDAIVYVNDNPIVHATVTENDICIGGEITLTANLDDYNADMLEFHWYDNGVLIPTATELTYTTVPGLGEHNYNMTAYQRNSDCIASSDIVTVTVYDDPVITSVTTDLAEGNDTICEGRFVTLTAHISGGVRGGEVYTWYRNGQVIPGAVDSVYQETPQAINGDPTTYDYTVTVRQTAAGCESNANGYNTITVLPNPVLVLVTDPIVCDTLTGNIVMHANVTPAPTSTYNFTWYEDNQVLTDGTAAGSHSETMTLTRPYRDYPYNFSVELVNEYGCTTRDEALIHVNDNPIVHATVTENNICIGGEITLTANLDDYNAEMLEFHWYDNGVLIGTATELTYTTVPGLGEHNYNMTAYQRNSDCIASSDIVTVTVYDDPVITSVTTDLAEGNDTICEGRFVTLTAHISGGVRGGEVYTWYRNGQVIPGAVDSVYQETPQAINGDPTTYDYTVTVRQTAAGCESNANGYNTITVLPNPVLVLVTDPIVCDTLTGNIVMHANVTPAPTSTYNFTWYEDNQVLADGTAAGSHSETMTLTRPYRDYPYSFSVELVNEYGCTTRDDAIVYVNDNPIVHATVTENDICIGGEITLTANLDDYNADMLEFHWYDNGVLIPTATELTYTTVPGLGEHNYNMTALQRNSLCIASSDIVTVTVYDDPVITSVTTDLAEGNDTICEGRFVTLTAHISGGVRGGEVYTWYRNGQVIPGAVDSVYQETPQAINGDPTTYDYTVTVRQTAAGCESNANGYNTITVLPNPVLVLVTDPIVCDTLTGNIVMHANVTPAPTSTYNFTWYEDNQVLTDGTAAGSHSETMTLTRPYRDYPYSFSVELVNEYGCTTRDDAIVYVNDNPIVHATVTENDICIGGEITLTANLDDYNAEMLEFHWYDNGVLIPTATELTYTVVPSEIPSTHRYTMTAFQRNSHCIATSDEVVVIVNPDPIIDRVVLSDYIACEGAQVRVEAIPQNYTATSTDVYTWYRNGIRIPGATNRVLYDTPTTVDQNTQQFIYTAVVTLEQPGCTSLPVSAEALTIYRNPVVAITGDQHVCETDYTFLIANVDTVGMNVGNLHYTWFIDGQIRDNNAYNLGDNRFFAEYLYPRDEAYIVTVSVERGDVANACASISESYPVYVYPKPEVNITANVSDICENGEVTLQANLNDYNAENITFQWYEVRTVTDSIAIDYLPGGYVYDVVTTQYQYFIPGATGFRYTTTLAETTTLGVRVLQTNSQCYDIDEFTVTVHATPAAPIITVNNPMICSNGDARLTVTNDYSEYGTPVYAWMKDGVLIPGAHDYYYDHQPGQNSGTTYTYNAIVTFEMPGCTSAISDNADVVVIPDPAVTVTVDGPTTICVGGEVTFSANAQPTTLDYTYQWYDYNNQLMDGETASTLTVSPAANQQNYNYKVVVNSLPGCQIVVDAPVVTVIADPVVTLSIDNPVICQGGTSTLYVNVEGGISNVNGIAPYVYNWYNNLSTETPFATTTENFYVLPANQATDSFAYWVEVSADAYGCASTSNNINQLVVADPIVNILVAPTYPETVCDGGNTMLVASVQGGFGDNSYQWYRNETILVGETNPTLNTGILSVNDLNSYRVIVTQTGSDCETASDTFAVPVIPSYNVVVSALNNATVCEGGTTTMEATITNEILANDNPTFQWYEIIDGANVAISGANSSRYTTSPLLTDGNHTYFVAVNSQVTGSGCSAHSNSFYTAIVDDPTVVVSTTAVNNVVCEGDVVRVNATVIPADGDYTYNWTWTNGTNTYNFTNNEPTFAPTDLPASTNGYLFNVSIVSADPNSGCNATSNSNVYVTVMPRPVITISADNAVVCAGGHVELTANHNASDYTGYNYAWTVNGQTMPSTLQTITVPAYMVTDGNINASVVVTSSQLTLNCSSTATLTEPVQVVAQPTVSAAADYLTMCEGAAPVLTATVNSNASNAALTYQWQVGGNTINGANGNVYQSAPLAAGTYNFKVRVMSENSALNCQSDWSDAVVVRVAETPVIGITSADGLALCEGGNITLTATVLNANNMVGNFTNGSIYGAYNYVWMNNNNTVAANNNISLPQNQITETLNNVGNYNYTVYVTPVGTLANGCGVVISEPLQVVVNARPNWDAAVVYPASGNICLGEEVQLHAHITGGVTDMNGNTNGHIQWVVEYNGVASNVSNYGGDATHTPTLAGVYTYYPTYIPYEGSILGSGCAFTNSDQVSTFLTVHELPTAAFVSGDGTTLCSNVSDHNAALTIHFTGTAPFHFTVTDLSTGSSTMYDSYTNDYTIYVSPEYTTQYRITFLSDNYCDNGELGLDAIATVFVNDITFNQKLFVAECGTNEVTINFNMASGTANSDFAVVYANGLVVTGQIVNGTATFATPDYPGDYDAIFFVAGCEYPIIVRRPVGDSEFSDGTVPFMMQRWDDVVVINNNPATNGGHTFVSYQWYKNGELIEGAIYPNYQEKGGLNGYYSIEVTSLNEDGTVMTYTTCEQYFAGNSAIKVYPVPANVQQVVTIELNIPVEDLEGATLDIYNVTGALVDHITKVEPVTRVAGFKAAGTYFGHIMMANGETKTVKFVIVK